MYQKVRGLALEVILRVPVVAARQDHPAPVGRGLAAPAVVRRDRDRALAVRVVARQAQDQAPAAVPALAGEEEVAVVAFDLTNLPS